MEVIIDKIRRSTISTMSMLTCFIIHFFALEALWGANDAMRKLWKIRLSLFLLPLICSILFFIILLDVSQSRYIYDLDPNHRIDLEVEKNTAAHATLENEIAQLNGRITVNGISIEKLKTVLETHEAKMARLEDRSQALLWLTGIVCVAVIGHLFGFIFQIGLKRELRKLRAAEETDG